jgi:hypothetical protein
MEERETPPRNNSPTVTTESVATMGVAELEACLAQALDPLMPVEVLQAVLERLHNQRAQ